uniref:Receptor accessory protein 1 n=1 Tax=Equus asinus TaxID=9793 RepID=A0A9L0IFR8_EQUAS
MVSWIISRLVVLIFGTLYPAYYSYKAVKSKDIKEYGQGALSERLRSFSMQDLSTIRGDGAPAPSGPPPPGSGRASGKHGQPKMSRSASESAGSSGTA